MLSIKTFEFHTGLRQLFEPTTRVVTVYVQGMELHIPPRERRGNLFPSNGDDPKRRGQPRIGLVVDKIVCTDLTLAIETSKPGKPPLVFTIRNLTLRDVGAKQPLLYDAFLINPKPVGDIHSSGRFGPWQDDNPRDTPIDGTFAFTNADLSTIKGISGTLSSTGRFAGALSEIAVTGSTDTPDFALDVSQHPIALHTEYDALVDGTSGDTTLRSVRASFLRTTLDASGTIFRSLPSADTPNIPGHDIELAVASQQARVEDLLVLGAKTAPPLLRGDLAIQTRLSIQPGPIPVAKKMRLQGTFTMRGTIFSNPKFQQIIDKLSERAQGNPGQATAAAPLAASQMAGKFTLASTVLHLPSLTYTLPGARIHILGDYSLDGQIFEFKGTVRTDATASQMLTGWKSLLARPLDPLLRKNGAGVEVPIVISGTKSEPRFGVALGKFHVDISPHKKN